MYVRTIPLVKFKKNLEKEKHILHTIARLTLFTRPFYHTRDENLLKGPGHGVKRRPCHQNRGRL